MSFVVFAGASQIAAVQLIGLSAPVAVIWLGTLMINLRMMMYSATIAPHVRALPNPWKMFVAYLLTTRPSPTACSAFKKTSRRTAACTTWASPRPPGWCGC